MPNVRNKHWWTYQFVFKFGDGSIKNYSFKTNRGYIYAEGIAFNNATWDGTRDYLYAGKYKAEVPNDK